MYDWFHIFLVHGICGIEMGLLLGQLQDEGYSNDVVMEFTQQFSWPVQFRSSAPPADALSKRAKYDPVKLSGGETLQFMSILRIFILTSVNATGDVLKDAIVSFFSLCSGMDALTGMTRGVACTPQHLQSLVLAHLQAFQKSHGVDSWVPKFHMSLHLAMMLERFNLLINCFCHERKHKVIKNFANQRFDTSKSWEKGLLQDVLHKQLQALAEPANMPNMEVGLLSPHPPQRRVLEVLRRLARSLSMLKFSERF